MLKMAEQNLQTREIGPKRKITPSQNAPWRHGAGSPSPGHDGVPTLARLGSVIRQRQLRSRARPPTYLFLFKAIAFGVRSFYQQNGQGRVLQE